MRAPRAMRRRTMRGAVILAALALVVAGCGDDDGSADAGGAPAIDDSSSSDASSSGGSSDDGSGSGGGSTDGGSSGGGSSSLVIDGENIAIAWAACYLEPQELGGGGNILVTARASGTNAAGDPVVLDFTRYDADSMFHGDDITIEVGEMADATTYSALLDEGAIAVSGGAVSGQDITADDAGTEVVVSFELAC